MTDTKALRELIDKCGFKIKFVAEFLGLSTYGFMLKVNNRKEFKTSEVAALCKLLQIESLKEKEAIFFANIDDLKSSKEREGGGVGERYL